MKTSRSCSPSRRRVVFTTLLCSAALLLLTNIGWSVWSGLHECDPMDTIKRGLAEGEADDLKYFVIFSIKFAERDWYGNPVESHSRDGECPPLDQAFQRAARWARRNAEQDNAKIRLVGVSTWGWPAPVIESYSYLPDGTPINWIRRGVLRLKLLGQRREFPLIPVWSGQACYAGFWFVVVVATRRSMRRYRDRWRARRGYCAACAYNLRGNTSGVCPECGTPAQPYP